MEENKIRLNKYIADCGVCSRRKADELIASGAVEINGQIVSEMGVKVDAGADEVMVEGKAISLTQTLVYYLLYKPTGVVSTCDDPQGRRTVLDIINHAHRLYPVGRLDYESSGLLILTNDGEMTHRVTHPSFEIEKEYVVTVRGALSQAVLDKLRAGVYIDGKKTHPAEVEVIKSGKKTSEIRMVIHEGRNRQIRKMLRVVGSHVDALCRVRLGHITLEGLNPGEFRDLTDEERDYLKGLTCAD
ncbi:MAG: pseudouridine synthase [Eubacteriales bacterium]